MDILTYLHTRYTSIGIEPVGIEIPGEYKLFQNYPNPFNPGTVISFSIPQKSIQPVSSLRVYDITGKEVAVLVNSALKPGNYKVEFNAKNLPSGIYIYKLVSGDFSASQKMILIK